MNCKIYQSFDDSFDVCSVFVNISKAFDKVGHDVIIFKLKQNGISGNLLNLLSNFLRNRKQRGETSSWADANAGIPQGSILGWLLFLIYIYIYIYKYNIYINHLTYGLSSNAKLFADGASLFSVIRNANTTAKEFNNDLLKIRLAYQWKMRSNCDPSKQAPEVTFNRKTEKEYHPPLAFNNNNVLESN